MLWHKNGEIPNYVGVDDNVCCGSKVNVLCHYVEENGTIVCHE
jgi:hypothetical protein